MSYYSAIQKNLYAVLGAIAQVENSLGPRSPYRTTEGSVHYHIQKDNFAPCIKKASQDWVNEVHSLVGSWSKQECFEADWARLDSQAQKQLYEFSATAYIALRHKLPAYQLDEAFFIPDKMAYYAELEEKIVPVLEKNQLEDKVSASPNSLGRPILKV